MVSYLVYVDDYDDDVNNGFDVV